MNVSMLEPLLRDATIKAIDGISRKVSDVEADAETKVSKLLSRWNKLSTGEKENVVGIVIAAATTAVTALVAMKSAKPGMKKAGKAVVKKVAKKMK